jgi:hypothetical protein
MRLRVLNYHGSTHFGTHALCFAHAQKPDMDTGSTFRTSRVPLIFQPPTSPLVAFTTPVFSQPPASICRCSCAGISAVFPPSLWQHLITRPIIAHKISRARPLVSQNDALVVRPRIRYTCALSTSNSHCLKKTSNSHSLKNKTINMPRFFRNTDKSIYTRIHSPSHMRTLSLWAVAVWKDRMSD